MYLRGGKQVNKTGAQARAQKASQQANVAVQLTKWVRCEVMRKSKMKPIQKYPGDSEFQYGNTLNAIISCWNEKPFWEIHSAARTEFDVLFRCVKKKQQQNNNKSQEKKKTR